MAEKHVLEKLAEVNPDAEIWWDSSPLVYKSWAQGMLEKAPEGMRNLWQEQLNRLFDPEHPGATIFRGVTTNPPLSLNAIKDNPPFWADFVKDLRRILPPCLGEIGPQTWLPFGPGRPAVRLRYGEDAHPGHGFGGTQPEHHDQVPGYPGRV